MALYSDYIGTSQCRERAPSTPSISAQAEGTSDAYKIEIIIISGPRGLTPRRMWCTDQDTAEAVRRPAGRLTASTFTQIVAAQQSSDWALSYSHTHPFPPHCLYPGISVRVTEPMMVHRVRIIAGARLKCRNR
jgi:hypothetical protein